MTTNKKQPQTTPQPEVRCSDCCLVEESRTIEGYAIVFNQWSNYLQAIVKGSIVSFREMILPGAIDGLIDRSDVTANFNHEDDDGILARSRNGIGTLALTVDEYGLKYCFDCPDTTLGEDTFISMKRGDINASSFAFAVAQGGDNWIKNPDGTFDRTISKIGTLMDISVVVRPAYNGAVASARSIEAIEEIEEIESLQSYYESLKNEYV